MFSFYKGLENKAPEFVFFLIFSHMKELVE